MSAAEHPGGCHCGAVRYVARGEPTNVRVCHCGACRKVSGGLVFARAVFADAAVERFGEVTRYRSSARLWRSFCPSCGALVYVEPIDRPGFIGVSLGTLDDPNALKPDMHIFMQDKVAWLALDDGLPQHPAGAPW